MGRIAGVVVCVVAAQLFHTDYGAVGVMFILFFYQLYEKKYLKVAIFSLINVLGFQWGPQAFALFAAPIMLVYNGKQGPYKMKYFFYVFYPAHLLILAVIRNYLNYHWSI
jgi:hypothetical protein